MSKINLNFQTNFGDEQSPEPHNNWEGGHPFPDPMVDRCLVPRYLWRLEFYAPSKFEILYPPGRDMQYYEIRWSNNREYLNVSYTTFINLKKLSIFAGSVTRAQWFCTKNRRNSVSRLKLRKSSDGVWSIR